MVKVQSLKEDFLQLDPDQEDSQEDFQEQERQEGEETLQTSTHRKNSRYVHENCINVPPHGSTISYCCYSQFQSFLSTIQGMSGDGAGGAGPPSEFGIRENSASALPSNRRPSKVPAPTQFKAQIGHRRLPQQQAGPAAAVPGGLVGPKQQQKRPPQKHMMAKSV